MKLRLVLLTLLLQFSGLAAHAQKKVLLYFDMEGISGVTKHSETKYGNPDYDRARQYLTDDVNAAVAGLVAGGASEVVLVDAHGSGNSEADVLLDQLHPKARFDERSLKSEPYTNCIDSSYAAVVAIGMHARAFTKGFIAHTYSDDISFNVNGQELSETGLIAASAARFGIPVVMVSGDDVLAEQLKEQLPTVSYATVKFSKAFYECDTLPRSEALSLIEQRAKEAMLTLPEHKPIAIAAPYQFTLMFRKSSQARQALSTQRVARKTRKSVTFSATDFAEGFKYSLTLMRRAQMNRQQFKQVQTAAL